MEKHFQFLFDTPDSYRSNEQIVDRLCEICETWTRDDLQVHLQLLKQRLQHDLSEKERLLGPSNTLENHASCSLEHVIREDIERTMWNKTLVSQLLKGEFVECVIRDG